MAESKVKDTPKQALKKDDEKIISSVRLRKLSKFNK